MPYTAISSDIKTHQHGLLGPDATAQFVVSKINSPTDKIWSFCLLPFSSWI